MVRAFPAMFAERAAVAPEAALMGEAACFDHPGKRAVAACQQCGRFVCQLCSVEMGGAIYCPSCVAAGAGQARAANADAPRTLYDSIALTLPIASLILMWPITIAAAPAALVLSIVKWKQPLSLVRQSRWRFVVAILIALAELLGWVALVAAIVIGVRAGRRRP
jgi:B-box zinc finger